MYICPHCNKPGITLFRKLSLGPVLPATCKSCHKKVGGPYLSSLLAFTPFIITIIVVIYFGNGLIKGIICFSGFIITSIIYVMCVPLIAK